MIDEKKLIEALKESNYHHVSNSREQSLLDRVLRIVEEQQKIEWIPIEEQLPNKERVYLVTCKPYDDTKVIVITSYFYGYGEVCQGYREFPEGIWEANQIGDVLAWMPLPEPYKGVIKNES